MLVYTLVSALPFCHQWQGLTAMVANTWTPHLSQHRNLHAAVQAGRACAAKCMMVSMPSSFSTKFIRSALWMSPFTNCVQGQSS